MKLSVDRVGQVDVITIDSEALDSDNVKEFKREMDQHLHRCRKVVLDFSAVQFLDSSGLGAILSCLRKLNSVGGDLKLCAMSKPVHTLFELVRMHKIFEIFPTRDEAVRSF